MPILIKKDTEINSVSMNILRKNGAAFLDGIPYDSHNLFYFSKRRKIKTAKFLLGKFSFLSDLFGYTCVFIDLPDIFDIVVLHYAAESGHDIKIVLEKGMIDVLIHIEDEDFSLPMLYGMFDHGEKNRFSAPLKSPQLEDDFKKNISLVLKNMDTVNKEKIRNFYTTAAASNVPAPAKPA